MLRLTQTGNISRTNAKTLFRFQQQKLLLYSESDLTWMTTAQQGWLVVN
jgi:hypothetical protein